MILNQGENILTSDSVRLLALDGTPSSALVNSFYWIDITNGVGGFWGSQMVEFYADITEYSSYLPFNKFKDTVYESK